MGVDGGGCGGDGGDDNHEDYAVGDTAWPVSMDGQ